jgi:hypothetical protein
MVRGQDRDWDRVRGQDRDWDRVRGQDREQTGICARLSTPPTTHSMQATEGHVRPTTLGGS